MKFGCPLLLILALGIAALASVIWWYPKTNGDEDMIVSCARNWDGQSKNQELGEEEYRQQIEPRWGIPRPEGLLLIGGVDWFSWARICRDDDDPEGIFRGEVFDLNTRYIGRFRYEHRDGAPLPPNVFSTYQMISLQGGANVLFKEDAKPPVDFFVMKAIDPDGYLQPPVNGQ